MRPVVLGTMFGSRLNLNGDQGNLLALRRYLQAAGFSVEIRSANGSQVALGCDFLLVGHGSAAAMQSIEAALSEFEWNQVSSEVPGLIVGSAYEWLAERGKVNETIASEDRDSQFEIGSLGPLKVLGYRNTTSGLPNLALNGRFICTMLHGPVLAKNPQLLDRAARAAVAKAGLDWPEKAPDSLIEWSETLNELAASIWALECEEEFPRLAV